MDSLLKFAVDYYLVDACIGLLGVFAIALTFERYKTLYLNFSIDADKFMNKILKLIDEDKIEEAISYCGANQKKPLAYITKKVLEKSDRDESAMEEALDIAASDVSPKLVKNLGFLQMVSNVVTLVGLLGTVVGLIMAFKAVSFADPSQKQTLLADGISLAMHATALGLIVAIPVMVAYSFFHAKQGRLFNEIDNGTAKLMEKLRNRGFENFNAAAYPSTTKDSDKQVNAKTA